MTTQEFLSQLTEGTFSEATIQEVHTIVGDATEMSHELAAKVAECLEREIEDELKDVEIDPATATALEQELATELASIEEITAKGYAIAEKNLQELVDMSQKVDVLERLHSN